MEDMFVLINLSLLMIIPGVVMKDRFVPDNLNIFCISYKLRRRFTVINNWRFDI